MPSCARCKLLLLISVVTFSCVGAFLPPSLLYFPSSQNSGKETKTGVSPRSSSSVQVPGQAQPGSLDSIVETRFETIPQEGTMMQSPAFKILDFLISIPVVKDLMFGVYRKQVVEKAEKMGLAWTEIMNKMWSDIDTYKSLAAKLKDPSVVIPDYYYAPIHAYDDGNLCWESALEEDLWSKLMIAPLYNNALDGDIKMRQNWLKITSKVIDEAPKRATDLGCGTGLSMYMLDEKFPSLEQVTGVDLSTYKLAIAEQKKSTFSSEKAKRFNVYHRAAEESQVDENSQDLACLCLVAHESPRWVTKAIFKEAYRILKPGGSFTMLDLDKDNLENLLSNPFVAAIYKQTEPYMGEFLSLQPKEDLEEFGFQVTTIGQASRSHRVYVARKPLDAVEIA